jgi:hypothetical protein
MMDLTYTEKVKIWQESVFQEIVASQNKDWRLLMPRRHGKSHILRRLAEHYIAEGKSVYSMIHARSTVFDGLNVKPVGMFIENEKM